MYSRDRSGPTALRFFELNSEPLYFELLRLKSSSLSATASHMMDGPLSSCSSVRWSHSKVRNCGLVCCSWFSHPNECLATSVTHHWKGNFRFSQELESEFMFRALTGLQGGDDSEEFVASKRDGQLMTCYTPSLESKFQLQSIHRATIYVAATRTGTNRSPIQKTAADQNRQFP